MLKQHIKIILYAFLTAIGSVAALLLALFIVFVWSPHIPLGNELLFRWKLKGELDSPSHIRQLTNFEWQKICIGDDSTGWPVDPLERTHYILTFYDQGKQVEEFYLAAKQHKNLELHVGDCFKPHQRFFMKNGEL